MSYRKNMKRALLAGVATATFASTLPAMSGSVAYAQDYTTGMIRGTVRDTTGTAVGGATIAIASNRGLSRTITANADGSYRIPRLPIGAYTVSVSMDGYESLTDQAISVSAGTIGDYTFTLAIPDSEIEEIIVSGTQSGSYDFSSTTTGISIDAVETFERIPIGRSATDLALLAPGASIGDSDFIGGEYLPSFNGASVGENVMYVNGMNITDLRKALGGGTVPFEFIQQVQVKTGGYEAEFGRATGGVTNMVTKSGTDEFKGGVDFYWTPQALRENSDTTYSNSRRAPFARLNELEKRDETTINLWGSGPLIKDKLYFFGMYQFRDTSIDYTRYTEKRIDTFDSPFYAAKLDFYPAEGHHIEATFFHDADQRVREKWNYNADTDGDYVLDSEDVFVNPDNYLGDSLGTETLDSGGDTSIFRYTGVFADWMTLSALYGKQTSNLDELGDGAEFTTVYDGAAKVSLNAADRKTISSDKRELYRVDADFYFDLMGEHHIRAGFDKEDLFASNFVQSVGEGHEYFITRPTADVDYFQDGSLIIPAGTDYFQDIIYRNGGEYGSTLTAQYIQDSWQVTDTLTLNIGVRNETFELTNSVGDTWIKTSNQIAPRFGFTWDPTGDGTSSVKGSFGRYYLPVATNTSVRQQGQEFYTTSTRYLDSVSASGIPQGDTEFDYVITGDGTVQDIPSTIDENISPMYTEEFILGYERMLDDGWTVAVRGMYRYMGVLQEDVAVDRAVIAWADANGYQMDDVTDDMGTPGDASDDVTTLGVNSIWTGFHQYVLTNPGTDMVVSTADLPGENGALVKMELSADDLAYPAGNRTYYSIDFEFDRAWDGKWSLGGSYTWSRTKGNYEGAVKSDSGQTDSGITTDFDQPGLTDGAYGFLPTHKAHRFKVRGTYAVNDWLTVGGNLQVESPRKFGCMGRHPTDNFAGAYGPYSWFCNGESTPRGSQMESDWVKQLDLSLNFTPEFAKAMPGELMFRLAAFNVFNSQAITDLVERGELSGGSDHPFKQNVSRYQSPRSIRLSAHYKF